jgi:hypothetical protein
VPRVLIFRTLASTSITDIWTLFDRIFYLHHHRRLNLQVTMAEQLIQRGTLEGHSGWVTSLATSLEK